MKKEKEKRIGVRKRKLQKKRRESKTPKIKKIKGERKPVPKNQTGWLIIILFKRGTNFRGFFAKAEVLWPVSKKKFLNK